MSDEDINTIKNIIENYDKFIILEKNERRKKILSNKHKIQINDYLVNEFCISKSQLDEFEDFLKKFGYTSPMLLLPYARTNNLNRFNLKNDELDLLFRTIVINAHENNLNEFELFKLFIKADFTINHKKHIMLSIKYYIDKFKEHITRILIHPQKYKNLNH